jgi:hypothetical protein
MIDGELVRQQKRKKAEPVKREVVKCLSWREFEELVG